MKRIKAYLPVERLETVLHALQETGDGIVYASQVEQTVKIRTRAQRRETLS